MPSVFETAPAPAIPITFATKSTWNGLRPTASPSRGNLRRRAISAAKRGQLLIVPDAEGRIAQVLFGVEDASDAARDPFRTGQLANLLPPGVYRFANAPHDTRLAALAFALGSYRFDRYRKRKDNVRLVLPDGVDVADLSRIADRRDAGARSDQHAANDMGPAELHEAARLAERHDAWIEAVSATNFC